LCLPPCHYFLHHTCFPTFTLSPLRQQHTSRNEQYHLKGFLSISTVPQFPPAGFASAPLLFSQRCTLCHKQKKWKEEGLWQSQSGGHKKSRKNPTRCQGWGESRPSHLFNSFSSPIPSAFCITFIQLKTVVRSALSIIAIISKCQRRQKDPALSN